MNVALKEAKRLFDLGFGILWLHPKQKRPVSREWTTGDREPWQKLEKTFRPGMNVGVRLGEASKVKGAYLACIDIDVKDSAFLKPALAKIKEMWPGVIFPEVRSGSGGGSRHLYFLTREPFKMITLMKGETGEICLYSRGRQMVLPPSTTKNQYEWRRGLTETALPELDVSELEPAEKVSKPGEKPARDNGDSALKNFKPVKVDLEWLGLSDEMKASIRDLTDVQDRSAFLLIAATALLRAGLDRDEILSVLTDPKNKLAKCAYDHAQTIDRVRAAMWLWKYTVKKVMEEKAAESIFGDMAEIEDLELSSEEAKAQTAEIEGESSWTQQLDRYGKGKYATSLKNLDLILENLTGGQVFAQDLFANRLVYGVDPPWDSSRKKGDFIQDLDVILAKRWFSETEFGIEPNQAALFEVAQLTSHRKRFHPVRDWLETLKWDGEPRINTWLKDYCNGSGKEPYLSEVSRKFLLAMVKRIYEPGCQWDYVLVLEGPQGAYKSSLARALASDAWFLDNLPDLKDKDAMLNLQGHWLIELGELTSIKRSDHSMVKDYLVRRKDTVRPPFGKLAIKAERQSVFIGTVNEGHYLKDPTGNRRFWPVAVDRCDVVGIRKVREQLFAEALHLYRTTKEVLMLSPQASKQAKEAQEDRRIEDDITGMNDRFLEFVESEESADFNFERFKLMDLFSGPGAPWAKWDSKSYAQQHGAQVLKNLGFRNVTINGRRIWKKGENCRVRRYGSEIADF